MGKIACLKYARKNDRSSSRFGNQDARARNLIRAITVPAVRKSALPGSIPKAARTLSRPTHIRSTRRAGRRALLSKLPPNTLGAACRNGWRRWVCGRGTMVRQSIPWACASWHTSQAGIPGGSQAVRGMPSQPAVALRLPEASVVPCLQTPYHAPSASE